MAVVDDTSKSEIQFDAVEEAFTPPEERARLEKWGRLRRRLLVWIPGGFVILLILICFVGPYVVPLPAPVGGDVLDSALPPGTPGHALGTDVNGNDILSRLVYGGRASLLIAIATQLIGFLVGGVIGAISGYIGGRTDMWIMRLLDVLIAFPSLVLTIAIAQILGPSLPNTVLAMLAFAIPAVARIARSATLRVVTMPYIQAAKLSGSPTWRTLLRHVAPNIAPQLLNFALLGMGIIIVIEGALSFLGMGVPAPDPSWGNMIHDGQQSLSAAPLLVLWPSVALLLTVLSFNLLGENLRDGMSVR